MRLQFLQATHLVAAKGHKAKDYKVGVHDVPSAVLAANHAKIERYIRVGLIVEGAAVKKVVALETVKERQLRLAEKLGIDVSEAKAALAKEKPAPVEEESDDDDDSAQEAAEPSELDESGEEVDEESESEESEEAPAEDEVEAPSKSKKKNGKRK